MSLIRDPEVYERFEQVIVVHGVRTVSELGYSDYIRDELPANELIGDEVPAQASLLPDGHARAVRNRGRITDLIESGRSPPISGLPGSIRRRRSRDDLRQHRDAARHDARSSKRAASARAAASSRALRDRARVRRV
jgi:ferredoxin-NADP reductase